MSIEAIGDDRHPSEPATVRAAAEIRALMGRHNVVQGDLQRVLRLSQSAVSKRLRGVTPWDINELATVADFFHMRLSELIAAAEQPQPDGPQSVGARRQVGATRRHGSAGRRSTPGYAWDPWRQVALLPSADPPIWLRDVPISPHTWAAAA